MLTELDFCILGIVWRAQPMTAYAVRCHLARSPTPTWSSSTGSVYPAIGRLRAAGLLVSRAPSGPRKSEFLGVSTAGMAALEHWLVLVSDDIGRPTADLIRTRVHFLAALSKDRQRDTLKQYQDITRAVAEELERKADSDAATKFELSEKLGTLGALAEVRARMTWLCEVAQALGLD